MDSIDITSHIFLGITIIISLCLTGRVIYETASYLYYQRHTRSSRVYYVPPRSGKRRHSFSRSRQTHRQLHSVTVGSQTVVAEGSFHRVVVHVHYETGERNPVEARLCLN